MRNTIINLAFVSFTIFLFSCQKDTTDQLPVSGNKVKTYTEDIASPLGHTVNSFTFSYDASDRITGMVSTTDPGKKFLYSYSSDNTVISEMYDGGTLVLWHEAYYKNNRIDSAFQYNDSGDSSTQKYEYDNSGNIVKQYDYTYSTYSGSVLDNVTTYTYDASGNQLKSEDMDDNVDTYEYYQDKIYFYPLLYPPVIPVAKRNLIKTHTVTSNGSLVGTANVTYTFDSSDRIASVTETVHADFIVVKTFTYF